MPFKRDNPGCACCCLDGQYCLKVHGCSPGIVGGPFHVEIFDGATMVASGDAGPASFTCFDLPGNKRYTRVITADRYRTDTATFDAPCSDVAWEIDETVNMQPADGYVCACLCPDPLRLPLTMNDGFGDVTLEETGGLTFGGACALRPVAQGIENCGPAYCDDMGAIETPVEFNIGCDFAQLVAPRFWVCFDAYGDPTTRLVEGSCPAVPCDDGSGIPSNCGSFIQESFSVQCSPFRAEFTLDLLGCLTDIYGGTVTIVVTEAA
jgi:hypothetical protein